MIIAQKEAYRKPEEVKRHFNMTASNTDVFDCQAKACEKFFQEQLPKIQDLKT